MPDDGVAKQRVAPSLVGNLGELSNLVGTRCQLRTVGDHIVGWEGSKGRELGSIATVHIVSTGFALKLGGKLLLAPNLQEALVGDIRSAKFQLGSIGEIKVASEIECPTNGFARHHFLTCRGLLGISEVVNDQRINLGVGHFATDAATDTVIGECFLY